MYNDTHFGLSRESISAICSVFIQYPQITKAVIYGSRAKGNYSAGSDIDLTLFTDDLTLTDLLHIENQLDDLMLPWKIDLSLFTSLSNSGLTDHIIRAGKIFYTRMQ